LGLLIKGGEILQRAGDVDTVVLDKTGTVTEGTPTRERVVAISPAAEDEILGVAASLERHSEHPVASAIVRAAGERNVRFDSVESFQSHTGSGVSGKVGGRAAAVGNAQLMRMLQIEANETEQQLPARVGASELFVAVDRIIVGKLIVADVVRVSSREAEGNRHRDRSKRHRAAAKRSPQCTNRDLTLAADDGDDATESVLGVRIQRDWNPDRGWSALPDNGADAEPGHRQRGDGAQLGECGDEQFATATCQAGLTIGAR